ncbi:glycosyltransferase family 39 protein [Psychrobacter frigidicola]|uniref:glycosyltransferase family 39 protein n=1 Tax=Psychrobacter frigidicola TaxID=45611 RepID=UPI001917B52B|nr:glycosyltransferase family 39 protein [Psychrobacter frigidicola]
MTPSFSNKSASRAKMQADSLHNGNDTLCNNETGQKQWRWFGLFLLVYFLIWSIAPAFLANSVPLDVSEGINWGSEWEWGYYKHPPLSSWILYSFYQLFGHIGPYLLSQLYVLLTLFLVYQLGKKIWSPATGLLGSALTLAVIYYSYPSLEFNHNVAQFPIWVGLYLVFYQALTRSRLTDWLLLGVLGGLGMLTKYSVIFLLLPMALYLLLPRQWPLLKQPQPWIAAFVMLAIFAPHLYWLVMHDWLPLGYANGRSHDVSETASNVSRHFSWVNFIAAQLMAHIPLVLMLALNRKRLFGVSAYKHSLPAGASLLWYLWAAPIVVLVVLSLVFGIGLRDMWGMPMWALSGLLAASFIVPAVQALTAIKLRRALAIWLTLATVLMVIYVGFGDKIRHKPSRMHWPEQALATQAASTWSKLSSCPLDSVSGDRWLGALVAMNSDFPSQMISGPASHSPWMSTERIQKNGTLVMWQDDDYIKLPLLDELMVADASSNYNKIDNTNNATALIVQKGQWQIAWPDPNAKEPLTVNWIAYVPSRCIK